MLDCCFMCKDEELIPKASILWYLVFSLFAVAWMMHSMAKNARRKFRGCHIVFVFNIVGGKMKVLQRFVTDQQKIQTIFHEYL